MGTSVMKLQAIALVAMVVLLGGSASGADAALRVRNDLNSTITVSHPPSCDPSKPSGPACITGFVLDSGEEESLNPNVPYPLTYLKIQVQGEDQVYCVPETDLKYLTATALLKVGLGACAQGLSNTIIGNIVDDSNLHVTCFQPCSA